MTDCRRRADTNGCKVGAGTRPLGDNLSMVSIHRLARAERTALAAAVLAAASVGSGCAVVSVAGAVVGIAGSAAGAAVSVGGAVVGSTVRVAGKVAEKTIDLAVPGAAPSPGK